MTNTPNKAAKMRPTPRRTSIPTLRFSPTAWAKLLFLHDYGDTEVGGFAISKDEDLLLVDDVQLVRQVCSWAHVTLDDESVADYFDGQVDAGRRPEQFARIWVHTHPGDCPLPSMTDEETFQRVFGCSDWSVMFILAQQGQTYARIRYSAGPVAELEIPIEIDYTHPFGACRPDLWEAEYQANVMPEKPFRAASPLLPDFATPFATPDGEDPYEAWHDAWLDYSEEEHTGEILS